MTARRGTRIQGAAAIALIMAMAGGLVLALAGPASAHRGEQSYLYLDVNVEELEGRVELPYSDIREAFGLALEQPPESVEAELEANLPDLLAYIQANTAIGADGQRWALTFDGVELLGDGRESDGIGYAIFPFVVDVPSAEVPRELDVTFTPFFADIDDRDAIVLIANDWQRGIYEEEANELLVFVPSRPSGTIDLGSPSQWLNFTGSIELGVNHIRTGPDHIFFVMVLLLPSVLVFRAMWRPAPTFGTALWRVMKVVSMFTVAHSITFTLAGLELVPLPPSRLVETVIAVSIAAAAVHNLRPILLNREWMLAFVFGLFHGLGFASLVDALDTSRSAQLISLLGRNVGIELGQIVVVLIAFPSLFLLRRTRYYRPLFVAGSLGLTVISAIWAIERLIGADSGISDLVELAVRWPRSLYLMVAVTLAAWAVYSAERRAGRLIDLDEAYEPAGIELSTSLPSVR